MNEETKKRISDINNGIIPDGYKKTKVGIVPVEWEECHFKRMFSRLKRKNSENNTNVLTISAQYGLINQEEFFNKSVASDDKSNYFLLYKGDFAYNKSYSNGYPFGAIKSLDKYDKGVVSPLYICFSPTDENKCPDFYLHYFENGMLNREIQAVAQEGARNHGLLNIGIDDFFYTYLIIPPLPEQQKIAEILTAQDKLISLLKKKTEKLKELKKAYLQKMFPQKGSKYPELRFNGFTEPWEKRKLGEIMDITSVKRIHQSDWTDSGIRFLRARDIVSAFKGEEPSDYLYISEEKYNEYTALSGKVKTGDLLVTGVGTIGVPMLINNDNPIYFKDGNVIWFKNENKIDGQFLYYSFTNTSIQNYISESAGKGTVGTYTIESGKKTPILLPQNMEEQQAIGQYFTNLDNLIALNQRKLEKEKEKKKALMQLLLTGKVRVKL